jgi:uncharacterized protein (DUF433 family)
MTAMAEATNYVHTDQYRVLRVGQTRVSLDSIVHSIRAGRSPEKIRQEYPALSLEEVYGAIAFYLANPEEIGRYLERHEKVWEEQRKQVEESPSPLLERLRSLKAQSFPYSTKRGDPCAGGLCSS